MCVFYKYLLALGYLGSMSLVSGCMATDTYYTSTSYGVVPTYTTADDVTSDMYMGNTYYVSGSQVITRWPYYSRPYIQREYYYNYNDYNYNNY